MQLLSSENQNLALKIPCKKVPRLLVERKNTSVVQKACRSWITKSASRAKPNLQQTKPNIQQNQIKENQIYNNEQIFSVTVKGGNTLKIYIFRRIIQDTFVWLSVSKVFT